MSGEKEQTKLSVEGNTAENYFNFHYPKGAVYKDAIIDAFMAGQNSTHALANSNLIELDKVVEIIEENSAGRSHERHLAIMTVDLITQIKQLSNKV